MLVLLGLATHEAADEVSDASPLLFPPCTCTCRPLKPTGCSARHPSQFAFWGCFQKTRSNVASLTGTGLGSGLWELQGRQLFHIRDWGGPTPLHATRRAGQGLLVRPTESELWETLDLPASQAGGGNTWMPRRIERGPSTRHAHEQMSFPFPVVWCLFLVCFFFGVLKAERDELRNAMASGTAPTDPQDSQQGFNPLTGGTGSYVVTARPKPWREIGQLRLEAQLARS